MEADLLWVMLTRAVFSAPPMVMWLVALVVGARLLSSCRPAGVCLITAAVLELARNGMTVLLVPLPSMLHGAGVLGSSGLSFLAFGRGVLSVLVVAVAYSLLIAAMFGWRQGRVAEE